MKKTKVELKEGQIWGVPPIERTLEIRVILSLTTRDMLYCNIGGREFWNAYGSFHNWRRGKKEFKRKTVLIGHYNFKTGKAVSAT